MGLDLRLKLTLAVALIVASCGGGDDRDTRVCEPGIRVVCLCPNGGDGTQTCRDDGAGFFDCDCRRVVDDATGAEPSPEPGPEPSPEPGPEPSPETGPEPAPETGPEPRPDVPDRDVPAPDAPAETTPDVVEDTRPDTPGTPRALGESCETSADCASEICLGFEVAGRPADVCATPCCDERACPAGFGCLPLGGATWCLPASIFPAGYTFSTPTGDACFGPGQCKSDLCDGEIDQCRGSCCTNEDCGVTPCFWSPAGSSRRNYCNPRALVLSSGFPTGTPCSSEWDCANGVCAQSGLDGQFRCADLCCGAGECPAGTVCGLVGGAGGAIARACVQAETGPGGVGVACEVDADCRSSHCIDGACRELCCLDADCSVGDRCRPAVTGDGITTTFCLP